MQWKLSLTLLNKAIAKHNETIRTNAGKLKMITQKEYWRFNGILLLCGITKKGGVDGLYKKGTCGIVANVNASKYMSHKRFKEIKKHWIQQFHHEGLKDVEPWWRVHQLVTGFNKNRQRTVASSRVKTLDESMSAFRPQKTKTGNLPNISFILRKPKNLGTELKSIASTSANGPIIHAEIQEGK